MQLNLSSSVLNRNHEKKERGNEIKMASVREDLKSNFITLGMDAFET